MAKTLTAGRRSRRTHVKDSDDFWDSDATTDALARTTHATPSTPSAPAPAPGGPARSVPARGFHAIVEEEEGQSGGPARPAPARALLPQRALDPDPDVAPLSRDALSDQRLASPGQAARRSVPSRDNARFAPDAGSPVARASGSSPTSPRSVGLNRFVDARGARVVEPVDFGPDDTGEADPPNPPGPPPGAFPGADEPGPSGRPSKKTKKKSRAATVFLVFGLVWLVAGIGMLGWVAWELWGTNIGVRAEYVNQISELENQWQDPAAANPADPSAPAEGGDEVAQQVTDPLIHYNLGQGFAILDIPKLGLRVPIIAGTDDASLARGVGWETYTQKPGEVGNFVVAGHHSSRGHPFDNLQQLVAGDEFTVETKTMIYTYRMLNSPADKTVDFHETWVTLPDPINQSTEATKKMATLLTCKEFFSTPLRSVGFAEEVSETPKS